MKFSQFNLKLKHSTRMETTIFNCLTGQFVSGCNVHEHSIHSCETSKLTKFLQAGIIVPRKRTEFDYFIEAVNRRQMSERWIDIMFVSSPYSSSTDIEAKVLHDVQLHIKSMQKEQEINLIKFRFCGWTSRSLSERKKLVSEMQKIKLNSNVKTMIMWMTDNVDEALELDERFADAFFFFLDLKQNPLTTKKRRKVFYHIMNDFNNTFGVHLGIGITCIQDLEQSLSTLIVAKKMLSKIVNKSSKIQLGIHLYKPDEKLYFILDSCKHSDTDFEIRLFNVVLRMQELGIPVNVPLNPLNVHGNCPFMNQNTMIYDWRGNRFRCFKDLSDSLYSEEKNTLFSSNSPCLSNLFLNVNSKCSACSILPICINTCPRQKNMDNHCSSYIELINKWFSQRLA